MEYLQALGCRVEACLREARSPHILLYMQTNTRQRNQWETRDRNSNANPGH